MTITTTATKISTDALGAIAAELDYSTDADVTIAATDAGVSISTTDNALVDWFLTLVEAELDYSSSFEQMSTLARSATERDGHTLFTALIAE